MKIRKSELEKIVVEETIKEMGRFMGGNINIEPLSDEEQEDSADAYYELFHFLMDSELPGNKPSDKLQYALRWIAKFEQYGGDGAVGQIEDDEGEYHYGPIDDLTPEERLGVKEGVVDMDGETIVTGPDGDASPEARGLARQDDLQATMMKAAMEIKDNRPQEAYETLLRALAAAGLEGESLPGLD